MIKAALILAASAALGIAALAAAQENPDDQFLSVGNDPNWYLQRAGCTLARSENGNSDEVVRLQVAMGAHLEVVGRRPRVRNNTNAQIVLAVDGASEQSYGIGIEWEGDGRSGYRIPISDDMLQRISAGRRLEIRADGRPLRAVDLAGAGPAIAALQECYAAGDNFDNAMMEVSNSSNAM